MDFYALYVELSAAFFLCVGTLCSAIRTPRDLTVSIAINLVKRAHFTLVTNSNKNFQHSQLFYLAAKVSLDVLSVIKTSSHKDEG